MSSTGSPRSAILLSALFSTLLLSPSLHAQTSTGEDLLYVPPLLEVGVGNGVGPLAIYINMLERGGGIASGDVDPYFGKKLELVELWREDTVDLLPMVFFERGSSTIPERYRQLSGGIEAGRFDMAAPADANFQASRQVGKYYDLLNIVGWRMNRLPTSRISLQGGYTVEPGESPATADQRVATVAAYLQDIWGIERDRIITLPSVQTADTLADLFENEEGRRVTFFTDEPEILNPVPSFEKIEGLTSQISILVTIDPRTSPESVSEIELLIALDDQLVSSSRIPVHPDSLIYRLAGIWWPPSGLLRADRSLLVQAILHAHDGTIRSSNQVIVPIVGTKQAWQNVPMPGSDPYDSIYIGRLRFSPNSTPSIAPWQQQKVISLRDRARKNLDTLQSAAYQLVVEAIGEAGETDGLDPVSIATMVADRKMMDDFYLGQEVKRPTATPVLFTDMRELNGEVFREMMVQGAATWSGESSEEVEEQMSRSEQLTSFQLTGKDRLDVEAHLESRGDTLAAFINQSLELPTATVPQIWSPWISRDRQSPTLMILYRPEYRFYWRGADIYLKRTGGGGASPVRSNPSEEK